ncbi:MAG: right-handed parallel beta-helix repeat-containing protein [Candidatus Thorarchaeota archaeon]
MKKYSHYLRKSSRISSTFFFVTFFVLIFITSTLIAAVFSAPQAASPRTDTEKTSQPTPAQDNIVIDRPEDVYIGSGPQSNSPPPESRWNDYSHEAEIINTVSGPVLRLDGSQHPVHLDEGKIETQLALLGMPSLRLSGIEILNGPGTIIENLVKNKLNISLVNSPDAIVRHNIVANVTGNSTHPAFGIGLDNCSNSVIMNNTIQNIFTNASTASMDGAAYGIFVNNSENVIISENRIKNVTAQGFDASSGAANAFGIYTENCTGAAISLNNITDILGNSSGNGACPWAIFMEASNHTLIQDNRIGNLTSLGPYNQIQAILIKDGPLAGTIADVTIRGNLFTESLIPATENVDIISRINIQTEIFPRSLINVTIEKNKFAGTATSAFGANESSGIRVSSTENISNLFIAHNWFENMSTAGKGSGVYSYGVRVYALAAMDNVTVYNNTFIDKSVTATASASSAVSYGIYLNTINMNISDILVQENSFANNSVNAPSGTTNSISIFIRGSKTIENVMVFNNTITDNSASGWMSTSRGIRIESGGITTLINITVTENFIGDNRAIAISTKADSVGINLNDPTGGIYDVRVHRNNITDNSAIGNDICSTTGIRIVSGSVASISQVNVTENIVANNSATTTTSSSATSIGILVRDSGSISGVRVQANNFTDNSATGAGPGYSYGIWIDCNSPATVTDVTVTENSFADNSATATAASTKATAYGIFVYDTGNISNVRVQENNITDNSATATGADGGADSWAILIQSYAGNLSNILVNRNTFTNCSATGAGAGSGNSISAYGVTIYAGNPMTTSNFTMTSIAVIENTFLDASAKATGTVISASSVGILLIGPRTNISNVLISKNNFTDKAVIAPFGGSTYGVWISPIWDLLNTTVTANTFMNNSATATDQIMAQSYGIYLESNQKNLKKVLISKNIFTNNSATNLATGGNHYATSQGIYLRSQSGNISDVWIQENNFTDNSAHGVTSGGAFESYGLRISANENLTNATAIGNVFTDNTATVTTGDAYSYGVLFDSTNANQLVVANNTFTDNSATSSSQSESQGIRLTTGSGGGITNSLVHGNNITDNSAVGEGEATNAYGIHIRGSSAGVINATVTANNVTANAAITLATAFSHGIYVETTGGLDTINISSNTLTSNLATASSSSAFSYGITLSSGLGNINNVVVSRNVLTDNWASGTSAHFRGISIEIVADVSNVTVTENTLTNSSATATTGSASSWGISIYSDSGNLNNISAISNSFTDTIANGISMGNSGGIDIECDGDFSNISAAYNLLKNVSAIAGSGNTNACGLVVSGRTIPGPSNFTFSRNTIHDVNATAPAGTGAAYGLFLHRANDSVVDFNLISGVLATTNDYTCYLSQSYGVTFAFEREAAVDVRWKDTTLTAPGYTDYTGYRNDTWVDGGTWLPAEGVSLEIARLPYGIYNFTYDIGGGTAPNVTETIFVTITDLTAPTLTSFPSNMTYEAGTAPPTVLTWTLTDLNPDRYVIYRNGSHVANGTWTSGTPIDLNVSGLLGGVHKYTFIANDSFGNARTHEVFVTVTDTTAPTVTSPAPVTYEAGTTGHNLTWVPADVHPGTYGVYRNGTPLTLVDNTWAPDTPIVLPIDNLAVGVYNYTLVLTDAFGNSHTDEVFVTVIDTMAPTVTSPMPLTYEAGTTGHNLTWVPADASVGIFEVYRNGTEIVNGTWTPGSPIVIDIDDLAVGIYNYTIVLTDAFAHSTADSVLVTVADTTTPVLTGPADITYGEGPTDPALILSWTATDLYPSTYTIYQNGTQIASGTWTAGTPITLELDVLAVGVYNFTIVITDASGNSVSDTVIITVAEEEATSEAGDEDGGLDPIILMGGIMVVGVAAVGASGGAAYWFIRIRKKP